jgi:hypothetical protein
LEKSSGRVSWLKLRAILFRFFRNETPQRFRNLFLDPHYINAVHGPAAIHNPPAALFLRKNNYQQFTPESYDYYKRLRIRLRSGWILVGLWRGGGG